MIVRLSGIRYEGANIGNDTEFEVTINDERTSFSHDIHHGKARWFSKPLFTQGLASSKAKLSVHVQVIEEGEVVSDEGTGTREYLIEEGAGRIQLEALPVQVRENRGILGKGKTATFIFEFEAEIFVQDSPGVRVVAGADNGWLLVRDAVEPSSVFAIPAWIEVGVTRVTKDRDYFTVLEGPLMGKKGSVGRRNGVSNLSSIPVHRGPGAELQYHRRSRTLEVPELGRFTVARQQRNPFSEGHTYKLETPDFPQDKGLRYQKRSTFATSWFRIVDPEVTDRYLHTGTRSTGCVAVNMAERWDEIYRYLINRRLDAKDVGTLTGIDD